MKLIKAYSRKLAVGFLLLKNNSSRWSNSFETKKQLKCHHLAMDS